MLEREVFVEAIAREDPVERAAYLNEACQSDADLLRRVTQLLAEHERQEPFILDRPPSALDQVVNDLAWEQPGQFIGPYKLLEPLGEGGMGMVFLAQQTRPIERLVAIKIIKPGLVTRQVLARFDAERQAVARMEHPNIARMLDAGETERGRPFFVMELVQGVPITVYCDQKRLALRARIELVIQVCHAVQHAHQRGIIHRDLKPTNVLVAECDNQAIPKIIDFGVAKAKLERLAEGTLSTEFGQLVGTLEYMSPEQANFHQADVDTRSDVYSLGVMLYEILAGATPFQIRRLESFSIDEMLRMLREDDPLRPSVGLCKLPQVTTIANHRDAEVRKLTATLQGELDWIVLKALEKDRNRRYDSANCLASDLAAYLANQPVTACPPSALYRIQKTVSRNKLAIALAATVLSSLIVATVVSLWQAKVAREAEGQSRLRLVSEQAALQRAHAEADKAKKISSLLQQMLATASPTAAKHTDYTVRQMLEDFSPHLSDQLRGQPETEAAVRATIGNTYRRLQSFDQADTQLQAALQLRVRVLGPHHPDVAQSLVDYSANLYGRGDVAAAELHAKQALAIHRILPLPDRVTIQIFTALQLYAVAQSQYAEARKMADEALQIAARSPGVFAEEACILHHLADTHLHEGDIREAEHFAKRSVALHQRLHGPQHPETAHGMFVLANVLHEQQQYQEAARWYQLTLAIQRNHFADGQTPVLAALAGLARTLRAQGDETAIKRLMSTVDLSVAYPDEWQSAYFRGSYLAEIGQWQQADQAFVEAAERDAEPNRFRCLYYSALVRLAAGDEVGYRAACETLVAKAEMVTDVSLPYSSVWACALAPNALSDRERIMTLAKRLDHDSTSSSNPIYLSTLAAAQFRAGLLDDARELFLKVIEAAPATSPDLRATTYSQLFLALIEQQAGARQAAQQWLDAASETLDRPMSPAQRQLASRWDSILPLRLLLHEARRALASGP